MNTQTTGLTIDQAAAFAGVTAITVRHYHRHGLVAEPARDSSGCRRYRAPELLRLVQVRALAGAGIPLIEIRDLLDYLSHIERILEGPQRFHADVPMRVKEPEISPA